MDPARPPPKIMLTYDAYAELPNDGRRWELMDGDFYVTPAPSPLHQTVSRRLLYALMTQLELPGIAYVFDAPVDLILADTTVVQPDLVVVPTDRRHTITRRGIEAPPELVAEILSPSTRGNDERLKKPLYAKFGVPEYWLVDPDAGTIAAFVLGASGYELRQQFDRSATLTSARFEQVKIPLEPLFKPL